MRTEQQARLDQLNSIEKALEDDEDIVLRIGRAKLTLRPKSDDGRYHGIGHAKIKRAILSMCRTDRQTIADNEAEAAEAIEPTV